MKTSSRIRRKGEMFRVSKCLLGIVDKPHRAGIAPLSPWFPGKPGFPAKPVRPGCPGSPRDPVLPGGPGGPGGPGVLLRYPEGIWLSSMSTLLIWPSNKEDASERFRTETFKINSQSYMKIWLTVHKLFANLSGNGAHHVLGCEISLENKDVVMKRLFPKALQTVMRRRYAPSLLSLL